LELFIARRHIVRYQIRDDDVLAFLDSGPALFSRRVQQTRSAEVTIGLGSSASSRAAGVAS